MRHARLTEMIARMLVEFRLAPVFDLGRPMAPFAIRRLARHLAMTFAGTAPTAATATPAAAAALAIAILGARRLAAMSFARRHFLGGAIAALFDFVDEVVARRCQRFLGGISGALIGLAGDGRCCHIAIALAATAAPAPAARSEERRVGKEC